MFFPKLKALIHLTYQIFADADGLMKYSPYNSFIACWCGKRAQVSIEFIKVNISNQVINGYVMV